MRTECGNDIAVDLLMRGFTCGATCEPSQIAANFHAAWDFHGLIEKIVWDWGRLCRPARRTAWLKSAEATRPGIDDGSLIAWAEETHALAQTVWNIRPADDLLEDRYLHDVLPILDRQLRRRRPASRQVLERRL